MGLKYYTDVIYATLSDLLIQASIKTDNQFMALSDSSWKDCPDTSRSTESYIIIYQGGTIYHAHMFQDQFLNQVQKVNTIKHALQEWIYHISVFSFMNCLTRIQIYFQRKLL